MTIKSKADKARLNVVNVTKRGSLINELQECSDEVWLWFTSLGRGGGTKTMWKRWCLIILFYHSLTFYVNFRASARVPYPWHSRPLPHLSAVWGFPFPHRSCDCRWVWSPAFLAWLFLPPSLSHSLFLTLTPQPLPLSLSLSRAHVLV